MGATREAVIVGAVRTPIGKRNGSLSGVHPVDLLAGILDELMERTGADPGRVEDHITGCVSQVGEQSINIGRNALAGGGVPRRHPRRRRSTGSAGPRSRPCTSRRRA